MTHCVHNQVRACPAGTECMQCGRLIHLVSETGRLPLVGSPTVDTAVERARQERATMGPTSEPDAFDLLHDRPHESTGVARAAKSVRVGNGKTPQPMAAVELCLEPCPDHAEQCTSLRGHDGNHCSPGWYWMPGDATASQRRNARLAAGAFPAVELPSPPLQPLQAGVELPAGSEAIKQAVRERETATSAERARRCYTALDHLRSFAEAHEPSHFLIRGGLSYATVREALEAFDRERAELESLRAFRDSLLAHFKFAAGSNNEAVLAAVRGQSAENDDWLVKLGELRTREHGLRETIAHLLNEMNVCRRDGEGDPVALLVMAPEQYDAWRARGKAALQRREVHEMTGGGDEAVRKLRQRFWLFVLDIAHELGNRRLYDYALRKASDATDWSGP